MNRRVGGALAGLVLALAMVGPAAAQYWPAYGEYGYGTGFDYYRNPYSYPRPATAHSGALPQDTTALYGGYMPNAYYTGGAYSVARPVLFPSGQAYCQTAGSFLYCADVESAVGYLLAARGGGAARVTFEPPPQVGGQSAFSGVLATRTVGDRSFLVGTMRAPSGEEVAINCSGSASTSAAPMTCR